MTLRAQLLVHGGCHGIASDLHNGTLTNLGTDVFLKSLHAALHASSQRQDPTVLCPTSLVPPNQFLPGLYCIVVDIAKRRTPRTLEFPALLLRMPI